jgi:hypothetical protein
VCKSEHEPVKGKLIIFRRGMGGCQIGWAKATSRSVSAYNLFLGQKMQIAMRSDLCIDS